MKPTILRVADITPGTTITSLEGVDLEGEKALVVSVDDAANDKSLVVLYFPNLKIVKQYKVPGGGKSTVNPPPAEKVLKDEQVDQLRLDHPRDTLPIREFIPDSYFPADPNVTSPLTDILWRPTIRRTPWPRFYNYNRTGGKSRAVSPDRAKKQQLKQLTTTTIPENLKILKAKIGELNKAAKKLPEGFGAVGELLSTVATIYANTKKFMKEANQLGGGTKSKESIFFFPLKHAASRDCASMTTQPKLLNLNGILYKCQGKI